MADTLPSIRVTDSQTKVSRPPTASPVPSATTDGFSGSETAPAAAMEPTGSEPAAERSPAENPSSPKTGKIGRTTPLSIDTTPTQRRETPADGKPSLENRQLSSYPSIDPLSEHIWKRASPQIQPPQRARRTSDAVVDGVTSATAKEPGSAKNSLDVQRGDGVSGAGKDKKKAVTFLSRLRGSKKKEASEGTEDNDEESDNRPKGAEAEVFFQSFDNMEFSPRHPQPPGYIKISTQGKKEKEFNRVFLAQELKDRDEHPLAVRRESSFTSNSPLRRAKVVQDDATWALEFSKDGKYLATGGQDKVVRIWATLSSREERRMHENDEDAQDDWNGTHGHLSAPVFRSKPFRVYEGHTSPVLDLSWSKNNFLLSSSMDKTVRLWHVSRSECLCAFKHTDFVTSILFHPRDDRFFLAGSLDSKLRLWSIPDKKVAYWNQMPEMCTAVAFTPDGKTAIAGCLTGLCYLYETEGLKYQTQIHVKSTYGKNARGSKITGIQAINMPPSDPHGDVKLLITSNDSRIRMYNLRDKSLELKLKGNENTSSQIHARFSDDGKYIICGSEDKKVFIWPLSHTDPDRKDKHPVEFFEAHNAATTVCAIAPVHTRQLLSNSEDPLYDLCNPPPVTLISKAEVESVHSSRTQDDNGSIQATPAAAEGNGSFKRPEESPSYIARCSHPGGNIIVTADAAGTIKVFRQDCAYKNRMRSDSESLTRRFSAVGVLRRHSSLASKSSSRSQSRKDSSSATQPSRERILSWRQSITSSTSFDSNKVSPSPHGNGRNPARSHSPRKSLAGAFSHRTYLAEQHGAPRSPVLSGTPSQSGADSHSMQRSSLETFSSSSQKLNAPAVVTNNTSSKPEPQLQQQPSTRLQEQQPDEADESPAADPTHLAPPDAGAEQQQPKATDDAETRGARERDSSFSYWRYDAWKDAIVKQLQGANARANSPSAHSNVADHGGSSVSGEAGPASEGNDDHHLHRPRLLVSRGSAASFVSALSSELESDGPGGAGSTNSGAVAAASSTAAPKGDVRR